MEVFCLPAKVQIINQISKGKVTYSIKNGVKKATYSVFLGRQNGDLFRFFEGQKSDLFRFFPFSLLKDRQR